MHGLLSRLAGIDSGAERGLRVIEFFDQLTTHRADAEAVTRATAVLAETSAGVVFHDTGEIWVLAADGTRLDSTVPDTGVRATDVLADDHVVGRVWLGEPSSGDSHEWDELIISRMALALGSVFARTRGTSATGLGLADPALVHLLIRADGSELDTARAARLLGFAPGEHIRVVAADIADHGEQALLDLRTALIGETGRRTIATVLSSTLAVAIVAGATAPQSPPKISTPACVGPAVPVESASTSWLTARRGLRFSTLPGRRWTTTDDLGCLIAFADLDAASVLAMPDIAAIAKTNERKQGAGDIDLLEALTHFTSVREAASALHMHHSSVSYRVTKISERLGYDVRSPDGQFRVSTALLLWRLFSRPDALSTSMAPPAGAHGGG